MAIIGQIIKNGGIDPSYYDRTARAESGGRGDAKNPNSSAAGLFQFTKGTWRSVVDRYGLKYSDQDRFDKNKSREVMEFFTKDNAEQLKSYGINPNNTDLYTAHFMGVAGAHKLLSAQRENPNQSVYNVATPAQVQANKTIFLHKNGTPKTVGQVYEILGDKINKTSNYVTNYKQTKEYKTPTLDPSKLTPQISNLQNPIKFDNLAEEEVDTTKEDDAVANAKLELQQKQNEENLFNDLLKASQLQYVDPNQVEDYAQTEQEQPQQEFQSGGQIPISSNGVYEFPEQRVLVPSPNITMKNVNYPILGISQETGEQKMMYPEQSYFFKNTKTVLEIPQIKTRNKRFS